MLRGPLPRAPYSQYGARQAQEGTAQASPINSVSMGGWAAKIFISGLESSRRPLTMGLLSAT